MNVLDDTTWLHATRAEKVSVYEAPLPDTEGYDNPITNDDVGFNNPEHPPAYASTQNSKTYTPLAPPPNVSIGQNTAPEPRADTKYLVLMDDEGKLGNPPEVTPPHEDNVTQEPPADGKYLVLLDDEGKLGNPPEVPPSHEDNNTQEPPADSKYLVLLDDEESTPDVAPPRDDIDEHHSSFA